MNKNQAIDYITRSMQLRSPQAKSLEIFADYLDSSEWSYFLNTLKKIERRSTLEIEEQAKKYFSRIAESQKFKGFDNRAFPSFTFALATWVWKTRLMWAFVTYLFLVHNIQHFLLVAPWNTIYRKLVEDFSKMNNSKYVFKWIEEINSFTANIITKDNYSSNPSNTQWALFWNKLQINIFNIQQFAQKDKKSKDDDTEWKWIVAYSESQWESYFDYLSRLDDLVVLLDESHHYHAEAAFASLDRMNPLMSLEFTATPYTWNTIWRWKEKIPEEKWNIIIDYNLWNAIRDWFVKDPWVWTEADVDFRQFETDSIETDLRKLQLWAYFHERAKVAIWEYALENAVRAVKPVMLVVAKDTIHASELRAAIDSDDFRWWSYKWKVIEVHTKTKWDEADENIEKLLSLESPDNYVEVVIHVNMLKEWWDVANIYTIVPLRQSASEILTEQTIWRWLRLPYWNRVSYYNNDLKKKRYELVDRVMIVAHEKYSQVVEQARNSTLIQPTNIEQVSHDETTKTKIMVETKPIIIEKIEETIKSNSLLMSEFSKKALNILSSSFWNDTPEDVKQFALEQKTNEIIAEIAKIEASWVSFEGHHWHNKSDFDSNQYWEWTIFAGFSEQAKEELKNIKSANERNLELRNIPIPKLILTPHYWNITINSFNLNTSLLSQYTSETTILEESLQWWSQDTLFWTSTHMQWERMVTRISTLWGWSKQLPENTIIAWLLDFPLIDYEEQKELLLNLAKDTVNYYRSFAKDEDNLKRIIETNIRQISKEIYNQIDSNKTIENDSYLDSWLRSPNPYLLPHNFSRWIDEIEVTLESQINTFSRNKIYTWFKKACHARYKFDSSDEARLAYLLDIDSKVEDWLRPAPNQFEWLYWRDGEWNTNHKYEPDFVVELAKEIVMIEVKPDWEVEDHDVQEKKRAAEKYCEIVSENIWNYWIIKPWRYVIVPTSRITITSTITWIINKI